MQRWLGWRPDSGTGAPQQQQQQLVPSKSSTRLEIRVAGHGLASCTSMRLRLRDGHVCPARIIRSPQLTLLNSVVEDLTAGTRQDNLASVRAQPHVYISSWRSIVQRLLSSARHLAGSAAQLAGQLDLEPTEEMVVEAVLPAAAASMVLIRGNEQPSLVELLTRSDFHVRRTELQLQPCCVWVLSDTPHGAQLAFRALCEQSHMPATLPEASHAFQEGSLSNVRCVNLLPERSAVGTFPATVQMIARLLQSRITSSGQAQQGEAAALHGKGNGEHDKGQAEQQSHLIGMEQKSEGGAVDPRSDAAPGSVKEASAAVMSQLWSARAGMKLSMLGSLEAGFRWARGAQQSASARAAELRSGFSRLRHRRLWQQLQQEDSPQLLVLCISSLKLLSAPPARDWDPKSGLVDTARSGRDSEPAKQAPSLNGVINWGPGKGGTHVAAEVQALLQAASASGVPVLVAALSGSAHPVSSPDWHMGGSAAHPNVLVLRSSKGVPSEADAWRLKFAVYHALYNALEKPVFHSRL